MEFAGTFLASASRTGAAPLPNVSAADTACELFAPTREQIETEINQALGRQLSPALSHWVERYAHVGHRNPYLWKWCRQAVQVTTLPCVPEEIRDELCDTKTLGVMWDVMLDDLADQNRNSALLEVLLGTPLIHRKNDFSSFSPEERTYAEFTCDLWREVMQRVRRYAYYGHYEQLLRFDYLQLCNVMRYSQLVNHQPELLNLTEHDLYSPHNMHIMVCATIDLTCCPHFDRTELGRLREVAWHAQSMGRIGNLVTTWQRELGEGDFSSGVYASALASGDVTLAQLVASDPQEISAAIRRGGHEEFFLHRWQLHRQFLLSPRAQLHSFDVREVVRGLQRLLCLHLGSRGNK